MRGTLNSCQRREKKTEGGERDFVLFFEMSCMVWLTWAKAKRPASEVSVTGIEGTVQTWEALTGLECVMA